MLVVIGMIAALASLSVNSGGRDYEIDAAARRFADIAEYAMAEAQLSGTDLGVLIEPTAGDSLANYSYQWLQRTGNIWQPAPFDPDAFGEQALPANVDVVLEIEEEALQFEITQRDLAAEQREEVADRDGAARDDDILTPSAQVVFYASGEAIPGVMSWLDAETGELLWELEWDLLGRIELRRAGLVDEQMRASN